MKALVYVQHLLGTGHVVRAAALGRALTARGVEVTLVSGNRVPPTVDSHGLRAIELPAARSADESFSAVVDEAGRRIDEGWKDRRCRQLLSLFDEVAPDILVTETWPFGRNAFAFELEPLMRATRELVPRPLVAASVRDILVRKPEADKERRMAERARSFCDLVLVHGDPRFISFGESFPFAADIARLVRYTGYIDTGTGAPEPPPGDGQDEVVVSCGGGAVGAALLETALSARALSERAGNARWRVLVGSDLDDLVLADLKTRAGPGILVERARRDFPGLLRRARLSVSQCGYNTAVDVLAAGCAAVFVPFAAGAETEQTQRAAVLAERGAAAVVEETGLTPQRLATAIDKALALPKTTLALDRDGARHAAALLVDTLNQIRGEPA
ncbi:glycosyltransferase family protein [Microbaculum marinum]|uniref:Glycosyltransferase n=1 Tax=Microbaculum marinum TaxID=1764581 RepID=A0AAW9RYB0_9HYPH